MLEKQSVYVPSFDGCKLMNEGNIVCTTKEVAEFEDKKFKGYKTVEMGFSDVFTATLPYSLDLIHLNEIAPKEFKRKKINEIIKQYTYAIVNVTFKNTIKNGNKTTKTKDIRENVYENGFTLYNEKYVLYKRSSSKARLGSVLFIKEKYYKKMMEWSHFKKTFTEKEMVDIASLKAYESLTCSGIEDTVKIKASQILLIDEVFGKFTSKVSVTELQNNKLVTNEKEYELESNVFDGQCLLDQSIFESAGRPDKGMLLLRNRMFKGAGFSTNILQFLKDNEVEECTDIFGNKRKAEDIKLVITKSCLKLFKFKDKFGSEQEAYSVWLKTLDEDFGICKNEKESHYGDLNRLSYQIINSMPLTKDEVAKLAAPEIKFVSSLKNDLEVFKKYIEDNDINEMMLAILNKNKDFYRTTMFNEFRKDTIEAYIDKLKRGKVKVNGDYAVLFGNGYEMLLQMIGAFNGDTLHKGKEIWCEGFADGEALAGFRNPHTTQGNILYVTNKHHEEFDKYFNFKSNKNIVIMNCYDNDIQDRLSGSDQDSDTVLLSNDPILVKMAKESKDVLTPINKIKCNPNPRPYTKKQMAEVDILISQNLIGEIVNLSQLYNSYYYHEKSKEKPNEQKLKRIIINVSRLSSLSGLEIDKAKKFIDKNILNVSNELASVSREKVGDSPIIDIREIKTVVDGKEKITRKQIKPVFFKNVSDSKTDINEFLNCPMDYLIQELDKVERMNKTGDLDIFEVLQMPDKYTTAKADKKQIKKLKSKVAYADKRIKEIFADKDPKQKSEQKKIRRMYMDYVIDDIRRMKFNNYTIYDIFRRVYSENSKDRTLDKHKSLAFTLMFKSSTDEFLSCFKENK